MFTPCQLSVICQGFVNAKNLYIREFCVFIFHLLVLIMGMFLRISRLQVVKAGQSLNKCAKASSSSLQNLHNSLISSAYIILCSSKTRAKENKCSIYNKCGYNDTYQSQLLLYGTGMSTAYIIVSCMYVCICIEFALRGDAHGIGHSNQAKGRDP